ncbi:unnamed protein product [Paramecium sonneborni]|uniref:Uncharacterized protein n=1 Tax=Paramecium sonneborni TaxID=65129 RepID=A0A8S1L461_9CILI|nr:unnamed protein product [Paramecium sonneborni]
MFKPKSQKDQQQQPFYLSWFTNQGENLKRGGTAPQQSRKDKMAIKSPYQQPLITIAHNTPNPYLRTISQPKNYQNNIQQISKIYAGQFQGTIKRKSLEKRYDDGPKSVRGSFKPQRTFTQQVSRPFRCSEQQQSRPQTQQINTLEPKFNCENLVVDNYDDEQLTPREQEDIEIVDIDNNDDYSIESNEADSDEHQNLQLPTQLQEQEEQEQGLQKNASFVQKQTQEPIASIRKATATLNRPQTSEGTRRKRFMNSGKNDSKQVFETKKSEFELLDYNPNVIQEDDSENQEIIPISLNQLNSPKELLSIRSGQRRKQTEQGLIENYDQNERPPSRHKTPPKATGLELPIQSGNQITNRDGVDIPIKNMYAQIDKLENLKYNTNDLKNNDDFDDFDLGFFKMNNKVNLNKFQQKDGYQTDGGKKYNSGQKHPQSANLKYNGLGFQNVSYSPLNNQITSAHGSRNNEQQIVIKYNASSNLHKNFNNQPVKVPFQTSLDQDFLRLFANDCID